MGMPIPENRSAGHRRLAPRFDRHGPHCRHRGRASAEPGGDAVAEAQAEWRTTPRSGVSQRRRRGGVPAVLVAALEGWACARVARLGEPRVVEELLGALLAPGVAEDRA